MRNPVSVKVSCPLCGNAILSPADITIEWAPHEDLNHYRFACPSCHVVQRQPANAAVEDVLMGHGVGLELVPGPITEVDIERCVEALRTEPDPLRFLQS